MAFYDIPKRKPFIDKVRKFLTSDRVHADVFNNTCGALFENEVNLSNRIDDCSTLYPSHQANRQYYKGNLLVFNGYLWKCASDTTSSPTESSISWHQLASVYGTQTTRSTAVTTEGTYSVDAKELNSTVSGTLANRLAKQESKIVITNTDPGEGATVSYPDGTVILVYEG